MPAEAKVTKTGGTKAERLLGAAQRDIESLEYALRKNAETLEHHNAVKADLTKQLESARTTLAEREKQLEAEKAAAAEQAKAQPS